MRKMFKITLTLQELEDLLSSTSFFIDSSWGRMNPQTSAAMKRLSKKLWKEIRR